MEITKKVDCIQVDGLFGHASHTVKLRESEPTILLAPNGAGKTHILRLTAAALSLDGATLVETAFSILTIRLVDGRELIVNRSVLPDGPVSLTMQVRDEGKLSGDNVEFKSTDLEDADDTLPPGIRKVGLNRWLNERTGISYSASEAERRFGARSNPLAALVKNNRQISDICGQPRPVFIDTWRLDASPINDRMLGEWEIPRSRSNDVAASRIRGYTEKLRAEITEARRASVQATQSADLSFAARALDAATLTVREDKLHQRYDQTVERYEALARNGLAVGEAPIPFPESTTPTVRRILSVFLDDWDRRLGPLLPVNEKLQTLREVLDGKLAPSGKRTAISSRGGLEFFNASNSRLPVSRLSSGEQHLVALFTLLLFAAKPGSLVLIDEPEISLHAAWKHAFLSDITRVAEVGELQILIATHSAGIVNGRWDLAEELVLVTDFDAGEGSGSIDPDDEEFDE